MRQQKISRRVQFRIGCRLCLNRAAIDAAGFWIERYHFAFSYLFTALQTDHMFGAVNFGRGYRIAVVRQAVRFVIVVKD